MGRGPKYTDEEKIGLIKNLKDYGYERGAIPTEIVQKLNSEFKNNRDASSLYTLYNRMINSNNAENPEDLLNKLSHEDVQIKQTSPQIEFINIITQYGTEIDKNIQTLQELQNKRSQIIYNDLMNTNELLNLAWDLNKHTNATVSIIKNNNYIIDLLKKFSEKEKKEINMIFAEGENEYNLILPLTNQNVQIQEVQKRFNVITQKDPKKKNIEDIHPSLGFYKAIQESLCEVFGQKNFEKRNWGDIVYINITNGTKKTQKEITRLEETIDILTQEYKPKLLTDTQINIIRDINNNYSFLK